MDFFATNKKAFIGSALAIGLPSTLLYCAEIWTILWHKPFHNSFYTLFCVRASTALSCTLASCFLNRLSILFPEWFMHLELPDWAMAIYPTISGYSFVSDNLAMGFILANRFTAIALPVAHDNIWRKFMVPVLLIVYGLPLYNIGVFWIKLEKLAVRDDQGQIVSLDFVEANHGTTLSTYIEIATICSLLTLALCIPINVAIWWAYRKRGTAGQRATVGVTAQQGTNAAAKAKADRIERRLVLFAVITFFGHVLITLYLVGLFLSFAAGNIFVANIFISQNSLVLDFGLVVLPAWLLLWASPSFRKQLLATFLPTVLYGRIYRTHTKVTIIKAQNAAATGPAAIPKQISIPERNY